MGTMAMEKLKKCEPVIWKKMERNKGWNPSPRLADEVA